MRKIFIIAVLACSSAPATAACHKYTHWYYPWPQSCRTNSYVARVPPLKVVLKEEAPVVKEPEPTPIEILNSKLKLKQETSIIDISVAPLFEINNVEAQRKRALEKIKAQLH